MSDAPSLRESPSWAVGQTVVVVRPRHGGGEPYITEQQITKIGRKWATVGDGWRAARFDLTSGALDGGDFSSPGRVWATREAYDEGRRAEEVWRELRTFVDRRYGRPTHLDAEQIQRLLAALRGESARKDGSSQKDGGAS